MRNPRLRIWPAEVLPVVELVRDERVDLRLIERGGLADASEGCLRKTKLEWISRWQNRRAR